MCVCSVNSLHTHQQYSNIALMIIGMSLSYYTLCFWEWCSNDSLMLCIVSYRTQITACLCAEYTVHNYVTGPAKTGGVGTQNLTLLKNSFYQYFIVVWW